jgi:hypothetical protein
VAWKLSTQPTSSYFHDNSLGPDLQLNIVFAYPTLLAWNILTGRHDQRLRELEIAASGENRRCLHGDSWTRYRILRRTSVVSSTAGMCDVSPLLLSHNYRNMDVVVPHTTERQQRLLSSEPCIQEYAANITFYVCNSWMLTHRPERFRKASFGDQSNPQAAMLCVIT